MLTSLNKLVQKKKFYIEIMSLCLIVPYYKVMSIYFR